MVARADLHIAMVCFCVSCVARATDPLNETLLDLPGEASHQTGRDGAVGYYAKVHAWYVGFIHLAGFIVTYFLIWYIFQDYLFAVLHPVGDVRVLRWGDWVHFIFGLVQMLAAFVVPWICFCAHLMSGNSGNQGLPWEAHCFYLLVEGLALPWQVIAPLKARAPVVAGRPRLPEIRAWRVPLFGYAGVTAEFYVFNLQLLWCANLYLDSVSTVLAFYLDYPLKQWMLGLLLTSYVLQSVAAWIASHDREFANRMFVAMLAGICPNGMPQEMAETMKLMRFFTENLTQVYFQISMAVWHGNMIFPWISAAVSLCLAIREIVSGVGLLCNWLQTPDLPMLPASDVEIQGSSE